MKKPSFLERLTGAAPAIDYDRVLSDETTYDDTDESVDEYEEKDTWDDDHIEPHTPQEGELPVDMYQTHDAIVIRALVAGVSPADMEISITRDMVTIRGMREEIQESADDNYYHRELFWGSFTRTLLLPEEVIIDEADASEKHGLLEIRLPKLDKNRSTQLRVKSHIHKA
jgi:HSP20 family protein